LELDKEEIPSSKSAIRFKCDVILYIKVSVYKTGKKFLRDYNFISAR
jgi:hypothetical protein